MKLDQHLDYIVDQLPEAVIKIFNICLFISLLSYLNYKHSYFLANIIEQFLIIILGILVGRELLKFSNAVEKGSISYVYIITFIALIVLVVINFVFIPFLTNRFI